MREKLNKLLAFLDTAGGSLFSRFYNPGYAPVSEDINEAIDRINSLLDYNARLTETYCRLDKEADWLAACLEERDRKEYVNKRIEIDEMRNKADWRKAAHEAVIKTNPKE